MKKSEEAKWRPLRDYCRSFERIVMFKLLIGTIVIVTTLYTLYELSQRAMKAYHNWISEDKKDV